MYQALCKYVNMPNCDCLVKLVAYCIEVELKIGTERDDAVIQMVLNRIVRIIRCCCRYKEATNEN